MTQITKEEVLEALKNVYDPEIGIDIVNLGLIYDIKIDNGDVSVKMTMTSPGCPLHVSIAEAAKSTIETIENVKNVKVDVVWDPPWTPDMMSDEAKKMLGIE